MMHSTQFARLLASHLDMLGLTVEGFAQAMNMKSVWLPQALLDGNALPQLATLPKLAAALQIDPVKLSLAWIATSQPAFADAIAGAAKHLEAVSTHG